MMEGVKEIFGLKQNSTVENEGFYISFIPSGGKGVFAPDDNGSETAICKDGKYYILNGDWRDSYAGKSFDECMKVFNDNISCKSSWSDLP